MKPQRIHYFKFTSVLIIYLFWVLWVGSWWLLMGVPVIYDIIISQKINWTFWKRRNGKNSLFIEWLDAVLFAVVAVTFINIFLFQNYKIPTGSMEKSLLIGDHLYVSKIKFGPRLPNTPLAFPLTLNTLPFTAICRSYSNWPTWNYKRLRGISKVKNNDIVVFNYPEGDTVIFNKNDPYQSQPDYYTTVRNKMSELRSKYLPSGKPKGSDDEYASQARGEIAKEYTIVTHPVDREDNYVKRCIAMPGDTLLILNCKVYVNSIPQREINNLQYNYSVRTDGAVLSTEIFEKLGIYSFDIDSYQGGYSLPVSIKNVAIIRSLPHVVSVVPVFRKQGDYSRYIFPHDPLYPWNEDQFGPLYVPKKSATIPLNMNNLCLYKRIITAYEHNKLVVKGDDIFINGRPAPYYTFQMDYYFMMGDNRQNSADSRYWGFVPEDHIVGSPKFIWMSLDPSKRFPFNIRWNRIFTSANTY